MDRLVTDIYCQPHSKSVFLGFCALSLCLLALTDRLSAQPFEPPLKGTEMLIEADGKQNGVRRRGIWAYEPETGKLRLLIENAQRPIWNPQHTHFAFRRAETFCVSDLRGKRYEPLDSLCGGDLIGWHPDGKRLFFWNPLDSSLRPVQTDRCTEGWTGFTVGVWEARLDERKGVITGAFLQTDKGFRGYHVGKVCFSPDGRKVALEVYRAVPLVGRLESKIAIADVSERGEVGPLRRLTRLPDRFYELNPVWSPDGQHIAFDVVNARQQTCVPCVARPDGEIVGFLIEASEQEAAGSTEPQNPVKRLPSLPDDHAQQPWTVLDWVSHDRLAIVTSPLILTRDAHMTVDRVLITDIYAKKPLVTACPSWSDGLVHGLLLLSPDRSKLVLFTASGSFEHLLTTEIIDLSSALQKADSTGRRTGVVGGKWLEGLSALERVYWVSW